MRGQFEAMIRKGQDEICAAVEAVDGGKFREDAWVRPGGGGGISRVLQVRGQSVAPLRSGDVAVSTDAWVQSAGLAAGSDVWRLQISLQPCGQHALDGSCM
jgi:coproporphyrinogen III oxidase